MALSEFEIKKIEKVIGRYIEEKRPPIGIREQVDLAYRIQNQSVEIFEIRPLWQNPDEKIEEAIAKATYIKSQKVWKIYWQRADLKWHRYEPNPEAKSIEQFISIVDEDNYGCFWG